MKTVNEVSKISGVSVRTLHHYDAIGLLKPSAYTQSGYRLYDDAAIKKLKTILIFRELDFSLADIKKITDNPNADKTAILLDQIKLLEIKSRRLDRLISLAKNMIKKGVDTMDFSAFDKSETEKYLNEAREKWGHTAEYKQNTEKERARSSAENDAVISGLNLIFEKFGALKKSGADSEEAQNAVRELKAYITENFYDCTDEILASLGQMYVSDERFTENIDSAGGAGTAEFVNRAIGIFCRK